jgi:transposase InsO family protein
VTSIDQLRVAAITYIRLQWEFGYLAVVLDAFSRRSLESALVLEALRVALMRRRPRPELVHHSDRGVQYASRDYTAQLEQHGIRISMSRLATPNDRSSGSFYGSGVRSCFRCGGWIDEDEFERYRRVNTSALATYRGCWERELCSVLNQETTKVFHRLSKKKIATPDCELL